jgi:hypothetical protein
VAADYKGITEGDFCLLCPHDIFIAPNSLAASPEYQNQNPQLKISKTPYSPCSDFLALKLPAARGGGSFGQGKSLFFEFAR